MAAKGFILTLLLVVALGAGAGYGAERLAPEPPDEQIAPTATPTGPQGGGTDVTVDDLIADMPEEARREMENNPEFAAMVRAQLREAIESGDLPPGLTSGTGNNTQALGGVGARNATPITGAVASFDGAALRLDTNEGPVNVTVAPETTVTITRQASEAADALTVDTEITVIAQENKTGELTAAAILVGDPGAGGRGAGLRATIVSYADGILTVRTEDGPQSVNVTPETIVLITTTASEAADEFAEGASLTVLVQRAGDGSYEAVAVIGGDAGGLGGRGFGGLP